MPPKTRSQSRTEDGGTDHSDGMGSLGQSEPESRAGSSLRPRGKKAARTENEGELRSYIADLHHRLEEMEGRLAGVEVASFDAVQEREAIEQTVRSALGGYVTREQLRDFIKNFGGARMVSGSLHKWNDKEMTAAGNRFYQYHDKPELDQRFVDFFCDATKTELQLQEMHAFAARIRTIKNDPALSKRYAVVSASLLAGTYQPPAEGEDKCVVMTEFIGMYLVSKGAFGAVPLRVYLALGRQQQEDAAAIPAATMKTMRDDNTISTVMWSRRINFTWYQAPMTFGFVTGEDVCSKTDHELKFAAGRTTNAHASGQAQHPPAPPTSDVMSHLHGGGFAGAASYLGGTNVSIRPQDSASQVHTQAQRDVRDLRQNIRNPVYVNGPTYVGDRCARCGYAGHHFNACPNLAHPRFDSKKRMSLLNMMSLGTVPLPN